MRRYIKLVCTKGVTIHTQEVFCQLFRALKKATGFEDNIGVFISTPLSIIFPPPLLKSLRSDR